MVCFEINVMFISSVNTDCLTCLLMRRGSTQSRIVKKKMREMDTSLFKKDYIINVTTHYNFDIRFPKSV